MSRDLTCSVVTLIPLGVVVEGTADQTLVPHGDSVDVVVVLAAHQEGVVGLADQEEEVVVDLEILDLADQAVDSVARDLAVQVAAEVSATPDLVAQVTPDLVAQVVDLVTPGLVAQAVVVVPVLVVPVDLGILAQVGSAAVLVVPAQVVLGALVTGTLVDLATHLSLRMNLSKT
jgi:hypothetical protein